VGATGATGLTGATGPGGSGAGNTIIATDTSAALNFYPVFVSAVGTTQTVFADDPNLRYVPSTGTLTANIASLTGNVVGGNVRTSGSITATGNITGGNLITGGNIQASFVIGNGSQLTGLSATNSIQNGNSNVLIGTSSGNVSININGVSPVVIVTPLGQTVNGILSATGTVTGGNVATVGSVSATGNITGQFILGNGSQLTGIGRSLTIGTRSDAVIIPLTASGSFTISTRNSGNVVVTATT
jgi:hypothetical protein